MQRRDVEPTFTPDPLTVRRPDAPLFGPREFDRALGASFATFRPLANGSFAVAGIPVSYSLEGSARGHSGIRVHAGTSALRKVEVLVTGDEATRLRELRSRGPLGLPPFGAIGGSLKPWGAFRGFARLRLDASIAAHAGLRSELSGKLGVFANALTAGAFGGIEGKTSAAFSMHVDNMVGVVWDNGRLSIEPGTIPGFWASFDLAFKLVAYAGVRVELRLPEIPVVTSLSKKLDDWPIVGWFVPDLSDIKWSHEYRKEWDLAKFDKHSRWNVPMSVAIEADGVRPVPDTTSGVPIGEHLRDAEAAQKQGNVKDDQTGAGREKLQGDAETVAASKASALAQIDSAKNAVKREKRANATLLKHARKASVQHASAGGGPDRPLTAGAQDPTDTRTDTTADLEKRDKKLDGAQRSTEQLLVRADALGAIAASDGPTRNEVAEGYDTISKNADLLGDKVNRGEEGFELPARADAGTHDAAADEAAMRTAMAEAHDAWDKAFDAAWTEKRYADSQVRAARGDDLHDYRQAGEIHHERAARLVTRVETLEGKLEKARDWYTKGDFAMGANVFTDLRSEANAIAHDAELTQKDRPRGDWDHDYVEIRDGRLQLRPSYRGKVIRSAFYPHDFQDTTTDAAMRSIGSFRATPDGVVLWEYRGRLSPRGDHWWRMKVAKDPHVKAGDRDLADDFDPVTELRQNKADLDPKEQPTLDHVKPHSVVDHWQREGHKSAYDRRFAFYNDPATITVVPKSDNSSGERKPDESYEPYVTRGFRGAKK